MWRLDASREVRCSLSEGWWLRICVLGAGVLATMTLAVPVLLFRHLWKKQRRVIFASSKGVQAVAEAYEVEPEQVETADDEAKKAPTADAEVPKHTDVAVKKSRSLRLAPLREPSRPKRPPKPKAKAQASPAVRDISARHRGCSLTVGCCGQMKEPNGDLLLHQRLRGSSSGERTSGVVGIASPPLSPKPSQAQDGSTDKTLDSQQAREIADEAASVIHNDRFTMDIMGWLFVRFRPSRWWWELVILSRKALLTFVVVFIGSVGPAALSLTLAITLGTLALHVRHVPFREDALSYDFARHQREQRLARARHAPWERRPRRCLRWLSHRYHEAPSLNGLATCALLTQLTTLLSGLLCLASGDETSALAAVAGWVALLAMLAFVYMVFRYVRLRCAKEPRRPQSTGKQHRSRSRASRRVQPTSLGKQGAKPVKKK